MNYVPYVIEKTQGGERSYDIYSRLLKDRIIMISGEINDDLSNSIIAQLLFLSADSDDDIYLYINSPGGSITSGMAIFDTMNFINADVVTICIGMAASMAAFLLASGAPKKRYSLTNSEVMIHQPLGGVKGQATEIEIQAKHILKVKKRMNEIFAKLTSQTLKKIQADTDRDNYMFANEALDYGIIDEIITNEKQKG